MKATLLTFKSWIGVLVTLIILFGFVGQSYSEPLTAVHVAGN